MKKNRLRVVLADDHAIIIEGLRRILEPDFDVVDAVSDGEALVSAARALRPDVIVSDITMPVLGGVEAARRIHSENPKILLIFLTMHPEQSYAKAALAAGGSGYVLKSAAGSELIEAIQQALEGKVFISPSLARTAPLESSTACERLTTRQREVLRSVAEGRTAKEIANLLRVSPRTVEFHKYRLMSELAVRTTADLIQFAVKNGVVT